MFKPENRKKLIGIILFGIVLIVLIAVAAENARNPWVEQTPDFGANNDSSTRLPIATQSTANTTATSTDICPDENAAVKIAHQSARGAIEAKVTIVEYGSYGCQVCRQVHRLGLIEKLLSHYPNDVQYVYISWPVMHTNDILATEAAFCANEQDDKFWLYHNALFELNYVEYNAYTYHDPYIALAEKLELDTEAFYSCLTNGTYRDYVVDLVDVGMQLKLPGTPSFFVNGTPVSTANLESTVVQNLFYDWSKKGNND